MNQIKKHLTSNIFVRILFPIFYNFYLRKFRKIIVGHKSYVGWSTIFEGSNSIGEKVFISSSYVGFGTYISFLSDFRKVKIGRFSSIGPEVRCVFGNHPTDTFVSTHPSFFSPRKQVGFSFTKEQLFEEFAPKIEEGSPYSIKIGNDVWIGARVTLLDGVKIGDGAVVASGALVNKDVPPYTMVGGVPAKFIKTRFEQEDIEFLLKLKWWDKPLEWIRQHSKYFTNISQLKDVLARNE